MGEVHYSRIPQNEWREEVRKMKEGGVTMIAAYVFWSHVEEVEGVFNWSGQRNLRGFLEVCKQEEMPVVLRLGLSAMARFAMVAYQTGCLPRDAR